MSKHDRRKKFLVNVGDVAKQLLSILQIKLNILNIISLVQIITNIWIYNYNIIYNIINETSKGDLELLICRFYDRLLLQVFYLVFLKYLDLKGTYLNGKQTTAIECL
jgi:hypothetical protein